MTVIKKDKKLAEAARKIFGDIVKTAYVSAYVLDKKDNSKALKELEQKSKEIMIFDNKDNLMINCDSQSIYLEFPGGRLVCFTNSEWGSISLQKTKLERI
jgi:hypothetical protein